MLETKYIELSARIEEGIKNGQWENRLPGTLKLSRELDADPATVLKAFRHLAEKGVVTIQGTKGTYITAPASRPRNNVIGVIGIKPSNIDYSAELEAMETEVEKRGYSIAVLPHGRKLLENGMDILLKYPLDGYIFTYSSLNAEIAAFLKKNGIPFVSCNKPVDMKDISYVDFDSEKKFEEALKYLLGLGHKRIAYVEFYSPAYNYSERILSVYKKILSEAGLPFDEALYISQKTDLEDKHNEELLRSYGRKCAQKLKKDKMPTAVLLTTPDMGYGFLGELKKDNLKVPADMSLMVYNDRFKEDDFFTAVTSSYKERSACAVKMLLDLISKPGEGTKEKLLTGEIIIKKSTSKIRGDEKWGKIIS